MAAREHSIVDRPATVEACKADREAAKDPKRPPAGLPRVQAQPHTNR